MKMAKASTADIEMALELSRFVEDLVDGMCPKQACKDPESDDIEWLEDDPDEQHIRIISALQGIARKGSIFRVTFGMSVLVDPRNELIDPAVDTLEPHPKIERLAEQIEALTKERDAYEKCADTMAAAHKVERDGLLALHTEQINYTVKIAEERDALKSELARPESTAVSLMRAENVALKAKVEAFEYSVDELTHYRDALKDATKLALDSLVMMHRQSSHDMMLTGDEERKFEKAIAALKAVL